MRVNVLFFGRLKDITGRAQDCVDLPAPSLLGGVFDHYAALHPELRAYAHSIVMARNHEFSALSTPITDGDEVAFLPPVSGGSAPHRECIDDAGHYFALTRSPIDPRALAERVQRPSDGAVVTFEGVVRNNTKGRPTEFLDYECYEEMALKLMQQIGQEIAAAHAIGLLAIVHRLGRMYIGEASIVIVASAPHRKPAFDAAFEAINRVKKTVPIWKKEYFSDGEVWVEGEWDENAPLVGPR
jgi:MoaE-MoaD fusion protein